MNTVAIIARFYPHFHGIPSTWNVFEQYSVAAKMAHIAVRRRLYLIAREFAFIDSEETRMTADIDVLVLGGRQNAAWELFERAGTRFRPVDAGADPPTDHGSTNSLTVQEANVWPV